MKTYGGVEVQLHHSSLLHRVQTSSAAHPASCTMGTGGSFLRGKAAGA
jgi:hypothetical protein